MVYVIIGFAAIVVMLLVAIIVALLFKKGIIKTKKTSNDGKINLNKYKFKHIKEWLGDFDEIKNNTIICDEKKRFIRGIKIKGICYPLLSTNEKFRIEDGYVVFLNSLTFPIMEHIQYDRLELDQNIKDYEDRAKFYENKVNKIKKEFLSCETEERKQKLHIELLRQVNTLKYAYNLVDLVIDKCQSEYILNRHYYILVDCKLDKEGLGETEKLKFVDSELNPIISSMVGTLTSVTGGVKQLTSEDLAEMLYRAYNPEKSGIYKLKRALSNGYFKLYVKAKSSYLRKKEEELNNLKKEIEGGEA